METIDKKGAIRALIEKGKAVGKLTTQEIDNAIVELDIEMEELDKLYELIETNNIAFLQPALSEQEAQMPVLASFWLLKT